MKTPKVLFYLLALLITISASSCELMSLLLAPTYTTDELIRKLELDYSWRSNLLKQTVLEGKVTNNHSKEISRIEIKATFYDPNGYEMGIEKFTIGTAVTPDGVVTFKEKFSYATKVGNVRAEIVDAVD